MRFIRIAVLAVFAGLLLAACSGGDSPSTSETSSAMTTSSSATSATSAAPTTSGTEAPEGPSADLTITAPVGSSNTGFLETELSAVADTPLTITFVNEDTGIPHNVQIFEGTDTTVPPVWAPEGNALINGPAEETYEVPALTAGTYTYDCFAHPAIMVGTLTVS